MQMKVQLKDLKPNPFRDFRIDPIDPGVVAILAASIEQDGFWGGVVCRKTKQGIEIGAGHHRIAAALQAGIEKADLHIGDLDDAAMIRVYARENATQRGNSGTANAGSIASATRFLVKAIMLGTSSRFLDDEKELVKLRSAVTSAHLGLGAPIIQKFLNGVPGVNQFSIEAQLANLKASGNYARIVQEVVKEIEEERREALAELARLEREAELAREAAAKAEEKAKAAKEAAKKAKAEADKKAAEVEQERARAEAEIKAKEQAEVEKELAKLNQLKVTRDTAKSASEAVDNKDVTFDFEGVAKHFKNASQINAFRKAVVGDGVRPYLPLDKQSGLAAEIVRLAESTEHELSAAFIRENIISMVLQIRAYAHNLSREEEERLKKADIRYRYESIQREFGTSLRGLVSSGQQMTEIMEEYRDFRFTLSGDVKKEIKAAQVVINKLAEKI